MERNTKSAKIVVPQEWLKILLFDNLAIKFASRTICKWYWNRITAPTSWVCYAYHGKSESILGVATLGLMCHWRGHWRFVCFTLHRYEVWRIRNGGRAHNNFCMRYACLFASSHPANPCSGKFFYCHSQLPTVILRPGLSSHAYCTSI